MFIKFGVGKKAAVGKPAAMTVAAAVAPPAGDAQPAGPFSPTRRLCAYSAVAFLVLLLLRAYGGASSANTANTVRGASAGACDAPAPAGAGALGAAPRAPAGAGALGAGALGAAPLDPAGGALDAPAWFAAAALPPDYGMAPAAFPDQPLDPSQAMIPAHFWRVFSQDAALSCLAAQRGGAVMFVGDSNMRETMSALWRWLGVAPVASALVHSRDERAWAAAERRNATRLIFSFAKSLPDIAFALEEEYALLRGLPPGRQQLGALVVNSGVWDLTHEDWARGVESAAMLSGHAARLAVFLERLRTVVLPLLGAPPPRLVWRTTTPSLSPLLSHARVAALAALDRSMLEAWNEGAARAGLPRWTIVESSDLLPAFGMGPHMFPDNSHPSPELCLLLAQAILNALCTPRLTLADLRALADPSRCGEMGVADLCRASLNGTRGVERLKAR